MVTTRNQRRQRRIQRLKEKIRMMLRVIRVVEEYIRDLRIEYSYAVRERKMELAESILPKKQEMEQLLNKKHLEICMLYYIPKYRDIYEEAHDLAFEEGYRDGRR